MKPHPAAETTPTAGVCVVSDGAAGNERQALALAQAMRLEARVVRIRLRAPWRWLGPGFAAGARWAIPRRQYRQMSRPWPALAIGCGRHAAVVTRALRAASHGATYAVQILDPRIDAAHFDQVIAPRHDGLCADNVIQTLGSLNPIDDAWLAQGRTAFAKLQQLPQPRTALLVGGPRRGLNLDDAWFERVVATLQHWRERDDGCLLITTSRRTPPAWRERLHKAFADGCTCFWAGPEDGPNPFAGYLALADRIVVTPDSVNMLSEACATGTPVFTLLPDAVPAKLAAFHAGLFAQGWLHALTDDLSHVRQPPPLREIASVASKVWQRIESTRPDIALALQASS